MKVYRSKELGAQELSEQLKDAADLEIHFEPMSDEEILNSDFDLIELSDQQSQTFLANMSMLDWQIQSSGAADAFTKDVKGLKPLHLSSMAFVHFLQSKHITLDTSKNAVLVGGYSFLMTYAMALAKLGFNKIYLISPEQNSYQDKIAELQKYIFKVQIQQLSMDQMTSFSELASLLVIDFELKEFSEIVEMLSYFNFVTENAIFFDQQNYLNNALSSEAEKASLRVLDSAEFHLYKYRFFQNSINIRS